MDMQQQWKNDEYARAGGFRDAAHEAQARDAAFKRRRAHEQAQRAADEKACNNKYARTKELLQQFRQKQISNAALDRAIKALCGTDRRYWMAYN